MILHFSSKVFNQILDLLIPMTVLFIAQMDVVLIPKMNIKIIITNQKYPRKDLVNRGYIDEIVLDPSYN